MCCRSCLMQGCKPPCHGVTTQHWGGFTVEIKWLQAVRIIPVAQSLYLQFYKQLVPAVSALQRRMKEGKRLACLWEQRGFGTVMRRDDGRPDRLARPYRKTMKRKVTVLLRDAVKVLILFWKSDLSKLSDQRSFHLMQGFYWLIWKLFGSL